MRLKPQLEGKNGKKLWKPVLVWGAALSLGVEILPTLWHHGILADKLSAAKGIFSSGLGASSSVLIFFHALTVIFSSTVLDVHAIYRA